MLLLLPQDIASSIFHYIF